MFIEFCTTHQRPGRTGRLDCTFVVLASEFSRNMVIEGRPFYTPPDGNGEVIANMFG